MHTPYGTGWLPYPWSGGKRRYLRIRRENPCKQAAMGSASECTANHRHAKQAYADYRLDQNGTG